ncbi:MAG: helix-turn-helix domain-containing protein [Kiritimatiellaeota bacterium]|nr:helix-turn-helix domain-containing protein [Kiritimatiellota bacterium]
MRNNGYFRDERAPVAIVRIGGHSDTSPHDHDFHELVLVLRGSGIHFTKDESYAIGVGDVFLIPPSHEHGYRDTSELDLVNILYSNRRACIPDLDIRSIPGYHVFFELEPGMRRAHEFKSRLTLGASELTEAETLINGMAAELESGSPGCDFMVVSLLMRLQCLIARSYGASSKREVRSLIRLADVMAFIERRHAEALTLGELARVAHMSSSTLHRSFVETIGFSPIDYLIRTRVLKGAEFLREGGCNVSEAAFRSGFQDSNYFSRQFRRVMGMPPGKYGRNHD